MIKKAILLFILGSGLSAHATDLLRLRCARQEVQADRTFISEIHFKRPNTIYDNPRREPLEGELLNYISTGTTKRFISGFSFFNVSYQNGIISGMSGDAHTRIDGSFTMTHQDQRKMSGQWHFTYTGKSRTTIETDFKCTYFLIRSDNPTRDASADGRRIPPERDSNPPPRSSNPIRN